jgi:hypothetical protein
VATGVPADPPLSAVWVAPSAGVAVSLLDPPLSAVWAAVSLPEPPLSAGAVLSLAGALLSLVKAGAADESLTGAVFCESVGELCDSTAVGAEVWESAVAVAPWSLDLLDLEVPATPLAAAAAPEPRRWCCDPLWWPDPLADRAFQLLACALCLRLLPSALSPPALAPPALAPPEPSVESPAAGSPLVLPPWSEAVPPLWSEAVAPWSDVPVVPEAAVALSLEEPAVAESAVPEF